MLKLRNKLEKGIKTAEQAQNRFNEMSGEFKRLYAKNDLEQTTVKEFVYQQKIKDSNLVETEESQDYTNKGDDMNLKTKVFYLCFKSQLKNPSHPINQINREFSIVF